MNDTVIDIAPAVVHPFFDFNDATDVAIAPRHEKKEIRTRLMDQLETVLAYLFPHGKRQGQSFVIGNLQGEPGNSLVVELHGPKRGMWIDFATGECGDALALWAAVRGFDPQNDFNALLEDLGQWLAVPHPSVAVDASQRSSVALDDLGPATARWNYLSADGQLLACVYRYDPPSGKQYRPWDAQARATRMPAVRPLYNLPEIASAEALVLVEGEKCADALMQLGIVATTAMGGAAAAIDKTDWSPLAGKTVAVWPDHDEAGAKYAEAIIPKLQAMGVNVRRVTVPDDRPRKWDAADAVAEGFDVEALLKASVQLDGGKPSESKKSKGFDLTQWRAAERFTGEPQARRWLVEGVFPLAQASLIAAGGGVGKSFLLLALARAVAEFDGFLLNSPMAFGSLLSGQGVAIYVTAEDDAIEVHSRLNALGPIPERLYVLPLPDAGGAVALFAPEPATRGPAVTAAWNELERQLKAMVGLGVVVLDPLQPLCALDLNVPENAQFVCSRLAALAASTGASVIVSHHFAKREASTPEQAREAIRGTGGLVDGVRAVYALWNPKEDEAKSICKKLNQPYVRGGVVMGGVVKANGRANLRVTTYLRDSRGLLVDRTQEIVNVKQTDVDLLPTLRIAIARAAEEGRPYTKSGGNGVYDRRFELPEMFHAVGKHKLTQMVTDLLTAEELVTCMAPGSTLVKWLDIPEGKVAVGHAQFRNGHLSRSKPGFKNEE